jgi:membrane-bound metal-dependent hydrolase YbcI (DUF457 family)
MPFTPFHFGVGGLAHAAAPRRVSFLSFVGVNVLIDVEPGYNMLTGREPLHQFVHTIVGATLALVITAALFQLALAAARRVTLPNLFRWQDLRPGPVIAGAALGAYSHILLDMVMHVDVQPFMPWSPANPLVSLISIDALQNLCALAGLVALAWMGLRAVWGKRTRSIEQSR